MPTVYYPAVVERGSEPGYSVFFPDLPGCTSAGDTIQEAARNAEAALRGHLDLMAEEGLEIPAPSELDTIAVDPDVQEAARLLVRADLPSSRVLRVNITLPEDLLRRIDAKAENRSRFLAKAAERALSEA